MKRPWFIVLTTAWLVTMLVCELTDNDHVVRKFILPSGVFIALPYQESVDRRVRRAEDDCDATEPSA